MTFGVDVQYSDVIEGVVFFRPSVFTDLRGMLWTSFTDIQLKEFIPEGIFFVHDKFSVTMHNVLRGIHYDLKSWKLVTCIHGVVDQVVVDMRSNSPNFKKWEKIEINGLEPTLVLLPPGVGNAFHVKSESAVYHYKLAYMGDYVDADEQITIFWNDESLGIDWSSNNPILSARDQS